MTQWRFRVWDPDATNERSYGVKATVDDALAPVAGEIRFDVDRSGNCISAEWRADPTQWDVQARDLVQIQTRDSDGDAWVSRWKGYVTQAGNPDRPGTARYRAVGLKERFYVIPNIRVRIPTSADSDDVNSAAFAATLNGNTIPAGSVTDFFSDDWNDTGFEVGVRYPNFEPVGESLDAYAQMVGTFVVPAGETYDYGGTTYNAGERVPPVRWGVNADGDVFFRRVSKSTLAVDETTQNAVVAWDSITAEEYIDAVRLVFFSGLDYDILQKAYGEYTTGFGTTELEEPVMQLVEARYRGGARISSFVGAAEGGSRKIDLENPLDLMTTSTVTIAANANWTDLANITDGDISTYGYVSSGAVAREYGDQYDLSGASVLEVEVTGPSYDAPFDGSGLTGTEHGLWRIRYSSDAPVVIRMDVEDPTSNFFTQWYYEIQATNSDTEIARREVYVPSTPMVESIRNFQDYSTHQVLKILGVTGLRLYEVEFYRIDHDAAARFAQAFEKPLQTTVASVNVKGLESLYTDLEVTKVDDSVVTASVERVEYVISLRRGARTIFHIGKAYSAEQEAQREVLKRFFQRNADA